MTAAGESLVTPESLPALVSVSTAAGVVEYANAAWRAYTSVDIAGMTRREVLERVIHPDDHAPSLERIEAAAAAMTTFETEYRVLRFDGAYRWHAVKALPVTGADGVGRWVAAAIDVDDRFRERELRTLLAETVPQLVWISRVDDFVEYWNERLIAYTGMRPDPVTGVDWRAVVHPDDVAEASARYGHAMRTSTIFEIEYRLRRHDGAYRWFLARAVPVCDGSAGAVRFIGSATDIDELKRAQEAMRFLAAASDVMTSALDVQTILADVARLAVPTVADWCGIYLIDGKGEFRVAAIEHVDETLKQRALDVVAAYPVRRTDPAALAALRGASLLLPAIPNDVVRATAHDAAHAEALGTFDMRSMIVVPLRARGVPLGFMRLVDGASGRAFDEHDLRLAEVLAKRLSIAVENARLFERERRVSARFQHAALPASLPLAEGLTLDAVYAAAEHEAEVGGDWYDAMRLKDGRIALTIGDVAGKGVDAAVLMASVRQALRVALLHGLSPGASLSAASDAFVSEHDDRFVTALVAIVDPTSGEVALASAGHPPPALRLPNGEVRWLQPLPAPPIGLIVEEPSVTYETAPFGALLVLYTDGLVESTRDVSAGEARLAQALADDATLHCVNAARLIADLVLGGRARDDVAVLAVRFERRHRWSFDVADAGEACAARRALARSLEELGAPDGDIRASEVIFTELIGNVVRHAPGTIDVTLDWSQASPVLHVIDRGSGFAAKPSLPADPFAEKGRGLFIVSRLGSDFRADRLPGCGMHVRVTLPIVRPVAEREEGTTVAAAQ